MNFKIALLIASLTSAPSLFANDKFERVVDAFNHASIISRATLTGEHAWAGYCISNDDDVSDAFFAYRSSNDPILGPTLNALEIEVEGSSNFFIRMDEMAARKQTEDADQNQWESGTFLEDELFSRIHWRFQTILRSAKNTDTAEPFFIGLRQCRTLDGKNCNGSGTRPFMTYAACYYFAQKF
jgi:hypothetical protein